MSAHFDSDVCAAADRGAEEEAEAGTAAEGAREPMPPTVQPDLQRIQSIWNDEEKMPNVEQGAVLDLWEGMPSGSDSETDSVTSGSTSPWESEAEAARFLGVRRPSECPLTPRMQLSNARQVRLVAPEGGLRGAPPCRKIQLFLPVLGMATGQFTYDFCARIMLSAIGDWVAEIERKRHDLPEIEINFCIFDKPMSADIESGRCSIGNAIARGQEGRMQFHVMVQDDAGNYTSRVVRCPSRTSRVRDIADCMSLASLPLPPGIRMEHFLMDLRILEGSIVSLQAIHHR